MCYESQGFYTDDLGGFEFLGLNAWGAHDLSIGVEDKRCVSEDFAFMLSAGASCEFSEVYLDIYDFMVIPQTVAMEDYFYVCLSY